MNIDIYTVIFLVLAVFIILRLRSVLGTRTGTEKPPTDPFRREAPAPGSADNVVTLPNRGEPRPPVEEPVEPGERWKGFAEPGTPVAQGLDAIKAADPSFDAKVFMEGARAAYEMIVTAFAQGDRKTLRPLLADDVFQGFAGVISEREKRGESVESTFVGIDNAAISEAELKGRTAQITVTFTSQLVTATRDRDGNVVDGTPDKVSTVTDVWTFARETTARDPNWKLVATGAA